MAELRHKCDPPSWPLFRFCTALPTNWVRGTIPPSVSDGSPSVSHSSTVKSPADLHTCVHTHTYTHVVGRGGFSELDMKLTSVNHQSKRKKLQTASPASAAPSFDQTLAKEATSDQQMEGTHSLAEQLSAQSVPRRHKTVPVLTGQDSLSCET